MECKSRTFDYGDSGDCVKLIQERLNHHGIDSEQDGTYKSKTKSAVGTFQVKNNLTPHGMVDPETWSKLLK